MHELLKMLIGVAVLMRGIPIGNILAKNTREELRKARKWLSLLIIICFIGAIVSLIFQNDAFLFTFLFIAIVTSRSLVEKKDKKRKLRKNFHGKH